MKQFPRLVFRSPGPEQCQGGTYAHALVQDEAQFDAFLGNGWHETLPEALRPPAIAEQPVETPVVVLTKEPVAVADDDNTPVTRDEMKAQAAKLGLVYPFNVTNKKLAEMIEFAMSAPKE
ncbi:MAG: hypothetical protein V4857_14305 [Pseudomonadota bacterium]